MGLFQNGSDCGSLGGVSYVNQIRMHGLPSPGPNERALLEATLRL